VKPRVVSKRIGFLTQFSSSFIPYMHIPDRPFVNLVWESMTADELSNKALNYIQSWRLMKEEQTADQDLAASIKMEFGKQVVDMIYFSNFIESSGLSIDDTSTLCAEHSKSDVDLDEIIQSNPALRTSTDTVSHAEVTQHLNSFRYLHERVIVAKQPLDKQSILNAHKILMVGLVEETGVYRECETHAGDRQFLHHLMIPQAMENFVASYNRQINLINGDTEPSLNVFYVAAKISYDFVAIHPFVDGNGRMSRLLMNIALLSMDVPFCNALGYSSGRKKARTHYFRCIHHARANGGDTKMLATVILAAYCSIASAHKVQNRE
jgi:Fic family protein